jgi:hypothetical protein
MRAGDYCPDCPKRPIERIGGMWCPGCRGWVVAYLIGSETRVTVMRPFARAQLTLAGSK